MNDPDPLLHIVGMQSPSALLRILGGAQASAAPGDVEKADFLYQRMRQCQKHSRWILAASWSGAIVFFVVPLCSGVSADISVIEIIGALGLCLLTLIYLTFARKRQILRSKTDYLRWVRKIAVKNTEKL